MSEGGHVARGGAACATEAQGQGEEKLPLGSVTGRLASGTIAKKGSQGEEYTIFKMNSASSPSTQLHTILFNTLRPISA